MNLENIDTEKWLELALQYGLKILGAIVIWIIGSWVIKLLLKGFTKVMNTGDYDESLKKFLRNLIKWVLKIVLIIVVLGTIGIETTSLAAVLAAAGLAIGLALQGSLGNFAGGVLIMLFKPFKIGDLIEAQGEMGVDLVIGVGYDSDIKKTKEVLMHVLTSHPKVLKEPAPTVNVMELADSSINFAVRPWSTSDDYWAVYFGITENVKEALDAAGIEIPYPHQVEIRKNA